MRALLAFVIVTTHAASAQAQWAATAYVDDNVAGDVQSGRGGVGASAGYYFRGHVGIELDGELHGHFFRDEDVAALQPTGVDLNTRAMLAAGNIVVPYCLRGSAGIWCPYAVASLGVIHASFKGDAFMQGADSFERAQTDLAVGAGGGVMHALTRWVGLRVDARYLHAFVDERSTGGGYFTDYGFWRVSVGVTLGGPQSMP